MWNLRLILAVCCSLLVLGCGRSWHDRINWRAEDYFDDTMVVKLCHAIEAEDLPGIRRLVADGADVNARGKGNMTPLLWAYPDNRPERFSLLLELGADPNVIFESSFNAEAHVVFEGTSVTHLASETAFPRYFDAVFDHGGDPNLESNTPLGKNVTPLFEVIRGPCKDKRHRIERLIKLGADINHLDNSERTPAGYAVLHGRCDITLQLLEAGADYQVYWPNTNEQLVHTILTIAERTRSVQQRKELMELLRWLEQHGVSLEKARADIARWRSAPTAEARREMIDREIERRKQRERGAATAKNKATE